MGALVLRLDDVETSVLRPAALGRVGSNLVGQVVALAAAAVRRR